MKMKVKNMATLFALLAASIYSINIPLSKLLLKHVGTTMMAGFLYFGAGIGLIVLTNIMKFVGISKKQEPLTKKRITIYNSYGNFRYYCTNFINVWYINDKILPMFHF